MGSRVGFDTGVGIYDVGSSSATCSAIISWAGSETIVGGFSIIIFSSDGVPDVKISPVVMVGDKTWSVTSMGPTNSALPGFAAIIGASGITKAISSSAPPEKIAHRTIRITAANAPNPAII